MDFIAASFVRKGSDLDNIRGVLGPKGASIKIISKVENQEGVENFDEILAKTDSIMVRDSGGRVEGLGMERVGKWEDALAMRCRLDSNLGASKEQEGWPGPECY